MVERVHETSNTKCNAPTSEPFKISNSVCNHIKYIFHTSTKVLGPYSHWSLDRLMPVICMQNLSLYDIHVHFFGMFQF
jgi:hypothetical protein